MNIDPLSLPAFGKHQFITYRLGILQSKLNAQAIRLLAQHSNITLTEWRVLALVAVWNHTNMADITRASSMDKGQVSRAVKSLKKKKYIVTKKDKADARARVLYATSAGRAVKDEVLPRMLARQDRLVRDFSPEDEVAIDRLLDLLEEAALTSGF